MTYKSAALFCLALAATAQDQPTFRAGSRLVQVDVIVRSKGRPVEGLKKEDFRLFDDGMPREISVFGATAAKGSPGHSATSPLPAGAVSNRLNRQGEPVSSATVLLIDRLNTPVSDQVFANRKIMEFLKAHGNRDRLGIYALGSNLSVIQDLTDDPDRVNRAVKNVRPQAAAKMSSDVQVDLTGDATTDQMITNGLDALRSFVVTDRVTTTRDALIMIARHLAKVPGRKNLIWISGSFPLVVVTAHETKIYNPEVEQATRALNDANVAVYAVDSRGLMASGMGSAERGGIGASPRGLVVAPTPVGPSGIDTMHMLTGLTGGKSYYNSNGIEDSIEKAMEDSELVYRLGFYASEDTLDEKFHKLSIRVDRAGVDVRFRRGYFASKIPPGSPLGETALNHLLRDTLDATAVGLTVQASQDAAELSTFHVRTWIDLHDIHLEHQNERWSGSVDLTFFIEGTKSAGTATRKIDIPDDQFASTLVNGIEVNGSVTVDGDNHSLRVVVQDRATDAAGSIRVALAKK